MAEETVSVRITGKQISIAMVALVTALGSYPLANWFSPDVRADAFTGADGSELEDRIEHVELAVAQCQRDRYSHDKKQVEAMATVKAKTLSNEYLIKQCMRATGQ